MLVSRVWVQLWKIKYVCISTLITSQVVPVKEHNTSIHFPQLRNMNDSEKIRLNNINGRFSYSMVVFRFYSIGFLFPQNEFWGFRINPRWQITILKSLFELSTYPIKHTSMEPMYIYVLIYDTITNIEEKPKKKFNCVSRNYEACKYICILNSQCRSELLWSNYYASFSYVGNWNDALPFSVVIIKDKGQILIRD
jgi:hypothetical protein